MKGGAIIGILSLIALSVSGCAIPRSEVVFLANGEGNVITCGPYDIFVLETTVAFEAQCISDYQRQGYERIPMPALYALK